MKVTLVRGRSTDSAVYKLARTLTKNGYDVKLLIWDRNNTLDNTSDIPVIRFNFKAPQDKFTAILFFPIWWIYELIFLLKDDSGVIHACDLDTIIPAVIAKIIKKKKLVYTIYDFYANNMPDVSPRIITNTIRSVVASAEKFFIGFTDALFLVDECRLEEIKGAKIRRIDYIYNSPPDVKFDKKQANNLRPFTLFYAGGMHSGRGIEYMIKAIESLDNVKLILAGPETDYNNIKISTQNSTGKIEYVGWLPDYNNVIKYTIEADALFRFNDPKVPKSKYESPNKLFEAMMAEKPIIVNAEIAASAIVQKEKCGIVVSPYGDVGAIKEAIKKLRDNPELSKELGLNGRKAYENKYSWCIMESRLVNCYYCLKKKGQE